MNKDEDDAVEATTPSPNAPTQRTKTTPHAKKNPKRAPKKASNSQFKSNKAAKSVDTEVIALTDANAKDVLSTPNVDVFVEFFAPWCGHCQMLAPELRKTAGAFRQVSARCLYAVMFLLFLPACVSTFSNLCLFSVPVL